MCIYKFFLTQIECGLDVGVGRFSETEIPDLSHFVEYMVSRGSEKYEHENDFIDFINEHGGCTNSVTDYEHTTFYFALGGIQKDQLLSALDRFTHFFIKPLMKKDVIKRMIETLRHELQSSLTYDISRKNRIMISTVPVGHPVNKFSWSYTVIMSNNVDDNKIDKLYDELHKFRERHYSAHRMKLVIQASLPLNALEKYVKKFFANIPSNWLPPDDFTKFKDNIPFNTPAFQKKVYKIRSVKDINQLHITWAMPSLLHLYKSKPNNYILWIIKHKGEGSLIDYLRKKHWSFDFLHNNPEDDFEQNSLYTLFNFILDLSHEGLQHVSEVLDAIFSFINLIKREGPQKRIYDEIYKITENNFRLLGNNDYVDCLCKNMHLYPSRDYITGRYNFFEYDPEAIQKCLDYLVPETVNIMIFNKNFHRFGLNKIDLWTNTLYKDGEISQKWIERWKSIEPLPNFHLPLSNTLVTSDVSLLSIPVMAPKYPIKIADTHLTQIWHYQKFSWPKCYINFQFIAYPPEFQSPKTEAFIEMYCNILKQILRKELFPSVKAEIEYDITVSETSIIIEMNGFKEKLLKFLPIIASYMMYYSTIVSKHLFELVKAQQLERYYNKFMKPEKLIKSVKLWILKESIHYTHIDTYIALRDINFEEFQKFVRSFSNHLYIQCLVQGDMTKNLAIEVLQNYMEKIKCSPLIFNTISKAKIIQIPLGTSYCKLKNMNKTDMNSVITNYYQAGIASIELSMLIDLIIIIMQKLLTNQLCIREQLSNKVFCDRQDHNDILGLSITVHIEAHTYTTEYVDQRIEEFLKSFSKMLEVFSQEELNIIKETLIIRKLKQCTNGFLKNEVDRNWNEIMKRQYMFDRFEKEAHAIKNIKIKELREWFRCTLNGDDFRKLSLHVVGTDPKEIEANVDYNKEHFVLQYITDSQQHNETKDYHITNIEHYKAELFIYSCVDQIRNLD
ncbi:Nardilysin [Acromyrmex echinatior]|uniref:Nardilysin n=1 Tax=Acromyrmex echinatior TaxID=103372 RepID=F4WRV3_ACREC|nr:Nardilysin [Acromyrmex echinatior]